MHHWYKLKERGKLYLHELMSNPHSEHSVGLGFAIGTFINIIPTFGISILIALLIMLLFKKVNKISLVAALAFWNPLTLAPVYVASYQTGKVLFDFVPLLGRALEILPRFQYSLPWFDGIYDVSGRFIFGNVLLAICISLGSYVMVRSLTRWYRRKKEQGVFVF